MLWLNRIPTEELTVSGRIIDLQIDDLPVVEEAVEVSRYLVTSLAGSFGEHLRRKGPDVAQDLEERKRLATKNFVECIEALAKKYSISLDSVDLGEELRKITEAETYPLTVKCAERYVLRIKCGMPDYMGSIFSMDQIEINDNRTFRQRLDRLLQLFKKELKHIYDTDSPTKYHHQNAINEFRHNALTCGLDKRIIKKVAYLSASFRIFAGLCLPKEDQRPLIEKVDEALLAAIVKQIGQECPQNILERYLIGLIRGEQYARIRGTHKKGKMLRCGMTRLMTYFCCHLEHTSSKLKVALM